MRTKRRSSAKTGAPRLIAGLVITLGMGAAACRTTTDDVHRWANTAQGPRKLVAVLTHDKYADELRVDAALTMVSMKPRGGRRLGLSNLLDALKQLPEAERTRLVSGMVPALDAEIRKPPTGAGEARVDTSIAYKDAAYALLTADGGPLVTDPAQVAKLREALTIWAVTDFSARMDDSSQSYGMEQVLRMLGSAGVRGLPALIALDAPKLDRMCDLVADLGDAPAKLEASRRLVGVAEEVNSDRWLKSRAPKLEAANKASKLNPTPAQFEKQLASYQEEELGRLFGSMRKVGQAPVVKFLLGYSGNKARNEKLRTTALLALEGHLDKEDGAQVEAILALASAEDTPDPVRDAALRRVGEMPRKLVADRLYQLFESPQWKIRWVGAELILKMSDSSHVDEFMAKLGPVKGMSITEPLRYGGIVGSLKQVKVAPLDLIKRYAESGNPAPVRLSALGYFFESGTKADLPAMARFAADRTPVPECLKDAKECEWKCTVEAGGKSEEKEIGTIGDFVTFCVQPAIEKREPVPLPSAPK
ncbi:MAG: hypothetical protein FJ104_13395 [Deltaproteobacteria bacterium]|nr:hypothetical protein [Deltaproteobacteria bacterium]